MTMRPKSSLRRAALSIATASVCWLGMSALRAHSQTAVPESVIERAIEDSGYEVVGPIVRRGATYVVDVVGEGDVSEQFIIDAHDGRLMHRYRGNPILRRHAASRNPSSPLTHFFDGLFGGTEDVAPLPPPPDDEFFDKPRAKPHIKRPTPSPVAQQAKTPSVGAATPAAPAAAATPAAAPAPAVAAPAPPKSATQKPNDVQVVPLE